MVNFVKCFGKIQDPDADIRLVINKIIYSFFKVFVKNKLRMLCFENEGGQRDRNF